MMDTNMEINYKGLKYDFFQITNDGYTVIAFHKCKNKVTMDFSSREVSCCFELFELCELNALANEVFGITNI